MDLQLRGRTALVTGASQGIGRGIAKALAMEGVKVVAAARRTELIEEMAKEVRSAGGEEITPVKIDLRAENASEALADEAVKRVGHIDILVNSAGGSKPLPFDASKELWLEGLLLNFFRLRELTHALVPRMRERKFGRVINLTGTSEPKVLNSAFCAKAGVHVWSKGLSRLVAADGVTVNCLQPGKIRSEQISKRWPTEESELEFAKHEIPIGRFGLPEEIAYVAVFLASPLSCYVTGTIIPVDGGSSHFAF